MDSGTALEMVIDSGRTATAAGFFQAGVDLVELLDEVAEQPTAWVVSQLRTASAVAVIAPPEPTSDSDRALRSVVVGLTDVSRGGDVPTEWSPDAVAAARRLAVTVSEREGGSGHLRLLGPDDASAPAERLEVLQPFTRSMPGAVRGRLVGLNVSRGNRASLRPPQGRVVRLTFPTELRLRLKEALLENVELRGRVSQDADGRIFHVRVEDLRMLGRAEVRWTDLYGFEPNITRGQSIGDYLEGIRGETE